MQFTIIPGEHQPWLAIKHEALGTAYTHLFPLDKPTHNALQVYGFGEIGHTPFGPQFIREDQPRSTSYLSAKRHSADPAEWVITLYPGQVLGTVPAEIALLMTESRDVEFPPDLSPEDFVSPKARAMLAARDRQGIAAGPDETPRV